MTSFISLKRKINQIYAQTADFIEQRPAIRIALVFSLFFVVFLWMYFSVNPLVSADDHFFHFRFAEIMRKQGFFQTFNNFKSIYFSKMTEGKYYIYYNFLFYLAVIPFTFITPLYLGIKLYAVTIAAVLFTVLYVCLRLFKFKWSLLWTLTFLAITGLNSFWRLFLSRPYVLAPVFLILLLIALHKHKYGWVFILSFAYLYWHSLTFFFPVFIAGVYFVIESLYHKKPDWRNLMYSIGGVLGSIGLLYLFTPGFFEYAKDVVFNIVSNNVSHNVSIPEGGEVNPIDFFSYINQNIIFFVLFTIAIFEEIYTYIVNRRNNSSRLGDPERSFLIFKGSLFFISISFFLGLITISGRFNDYFFLFAGFYVLVSLSFIIKNIQITNKPFQKSLQAAVVFLIIYLAANNVFNVQAQIGSNGAPAEVFEGVGAWLQANTKPGDIIFDPNWSWFTQLYYYSPKNNYVAGIEPRFLYSYNETLYWKWWNIGKSGYSCPMDECPNIEKTRDTLLKNATTSKKWFEVDGNDIADTILRDFHSKYIISSLEYPRLNQVLDNSKRFEMVYGKGKVYTIYKISEK